MQSRRLVCTLAGGPAQAGSSSPGHVNSALGQTLIRASHHGKNSIWCLGDLDEVFGELLDVHEIKRFGFRVERHPQVLRQSHHLVLVEGPAVVGIIVIELGANHRLVWRPPRDLLLRFLRQQPAVQG